MLGLSAPCIYICYRARICCNQFQCLANFKTINGLGDIAIANNADTIDVDGTALLPRDGS